MKKNNEPHFPVLSKEIQCIIQDYNITSVIDVTFGAGGHSRLFGNKLLFAIDRDKTVEQYNYTNVQLHIDKFSNLEKYITSNVTLIHADLGLSTMQIKSDRGFSFMRNNSLNMNASQEEQSLKQELQKMPITKIQSILSVYGDLKKYAKKIAERIDKYRLHTNITTTYELIEACGIQDYSVLAKIFQSFRIYINNEIEELNKLLKTAKEHSEMISIITFHSLEAKIVKKFFKLHDYKIKTFKPSEEEIQENNASRSATLYLGIKKNN